MTTATGTSWTRHKVAGAFGGETIRYMWGVYIVSPRPARGRGGRTLRRIVWHLYENNQFIGRPFHSARLAKAFAEALAALGDDRRARRELIADGAGWCYDKENEWREARMG
jgi:hypothetical protein